MYVCLYIFASIKMKIERLKRINSQLEPHKTRVRICMYVCMLVYICKYKDEIERLKRINSQLESQKTRVRICMYVCLYACIYLHV